MTFLGEAIRCFADAMSEYSEDNPEMRTFEDQLDRGQNPLPVWHVLACQARALCNCGTECFWEGFEEPTNKAEELLKERCCMLRAKALDRTFFEGLLNPALDYDSWKQYCEKEFHACKELVEKSKAMQLAAHEYSKHLPRTENRYEWNGTEYQIVVRERARAIGYYLLDLPKEELPSMWN